MDPRRAAPPYPTSLLAVAAALVLLISASLLPAGIGAAPVEGPAAEPARALEAAPIPVQAGLPRVYLSPASTSALAGEIFTLTLQVDTAGMPADTVDAYLDFDPTYLEVVTSGGTLATSIELVTPTPVPASTPEPSYFRAVSYNVVTNSQGRIDFSVSKAMGSADVTGSQTVAVLRLRAKAAAASTSLTPIQSGARWSEIYLGGMPLGAALGGATLAIGAAGGTPPPTPPPPTALPTATPAPEEQRIPLHAGWNWFSFAVVPSDSGGAANPTSVPVETLLAPINGKYDYVLGQSGTFGATPALRSLNNLAGLEPGRGYFIRMLQPADLVLHGKRLPATTPLTLAAGWNWVGYLPMDGRGIAAALGLPGGSYDSVLGEAGTFVAPPAHQFLNTLQGLEPGKGYVIRVGDSGVLVYGP